MTDSLVSCEVKNHVITWTGWGIKMSGLIHEINFPHSVVCFFILQTFTKLVESITTHELLILETLGMFSSCQLCKWCSLIRKIKAMKYVNEALYYSNN